MAQLESLLSQIDSGSMLLPEFQRGYVWNRDQVRGLLRSLYLGYPVGGLLVWETETTAEDVRGTDIAAGNRTLLLDGQQRLTTLYGIVRGRPPKFFEGDQNTFLGLRFSVKEETFEFYSPAKMKNDPTWIDVTRLFQEDGLKPFIDDFSVPEYKNEFSEYLKRLSQLSNIVKREFHLEKIVGADKTTDVVVDIFNRVNSGGTKLSKGDLALAKISAKAPELRNKMRSDLATWEQSGYRFSLDWLLRNVNAVATSRSQFLHLDDVHIEDFEKSLEKSTKYINTLLNLIASRLGLDHDRVLMGRFALPVLALYLHQHSGKFPTKEDADKALYWYIHVGLWGRFAGSTESMLAQDYEILPKSGLDGIIDEVERTRGGSLKISADDFKVNTMGSRFYPLLYLLTRVGAGKDLLTGVELQKSLLGSLSSLQVHHIFPKKVLRDAGYKRTEINAVANFCFLTQESNLIITKREPEDYFKQVIKEAGEASLSSQWIPLDKKLWKIENYRDFLAARRELLANAANSFLDSLLTGSADELALMRLSPVEDEDTAERNADLNKLLIELAEYGVCAPELNVEIHHPDTQELLTICEAYWPDGLQPGIGEPVILELDKREVDVEKMDDLDARVFYTIRSLKRYVALRARVSSGQESA
jgi:hypothetical protein